MTQENRKKFKNDSAYAANFNDIYFELNQFVNEDGENVPSRNGDTKEILNFKTTITSPYQRLVGGHNRCVNPLFLMAEAIWIVAGRNDVALLEIFNSKMKDYSDNGENFHAAYGYRLKDQIPTAIKMLNQNSNDRRVVLSIWDKELDLDKNSLDIPCNDLLMLKIRNGQLQSTIANRSNDLHWGLLTNIYQFSFLTECIANCLENVSLGTQTHNSQSLHVYTDLVLNNELLGFKDDVKKRGNLYDNFICQKLNFNFVIEDPIVRWHVIRNYCDNICDALLTSDFSILNQLNIFSKPLYYITRILLEYSCYKRKECSKVDVLLSLFKMCELSFYLYNIDYFALSINFLFQKLKKNEVNELYAKVTQNDYNYLRKIASLKL